MYKILNVLVPFLFVVFNIETIAQSNYTMPLNDKQLEILMSSCIEKTLNIQSNCQLEKVKNYEVTFALKMKINSNNEDTIYFCITACQVRYLFTPLSYLNGYCKILGHNVFLIYENITLESKKLISQDTNFLKTSIEKYTINDTNYLPKWLSPTIFIYSFHKKMMLEKKGTISYKVFYPIVNLDKKYWPLNFRDYPPYYEIDSLGTFLKAPWDYCNHIRAREPYKFTRTSEEIEMLKNGSFEVNLRKKIFKKKNKIRSFDPF